MSLFKLLYCNGIANIRRHIFTFNQLLAPSKLKMPALSPTMVEGTIVSWNKKEGDEANAGDVLCEVQTDKAVISLEAEEDSIVAKIIRPANSGLVKVGELIAVLSERSEDWRSVVIPEEWLSVSSQPSATVVTDSKTDATQPTSASESRSEDKPHTSFGSKDRYGPSVRLLIDKHHLSPEVIVATGNRGFLLKTDVLNYMSSAGEKPSEAALSEKTSSQSMSDVAIASFSDIPLTSMRKTIAKRLSESKSTIPHAYTNISISMDAVERSRLRLASHPHNIKLSVNDYFIKAVALALQQVPLINSSYDESSGQPRTNSSIDISVAVATPSGLITPIVFGADKLTLMQINAEVKRLAAKAREGKLQPNEFIGGTFSISNLGMYGIREFTAIINPPQSCILAVGASQSFARHDSQSLVDSQMATVCLSSDARVVDVNSAGKFLLILQQLLQHPWSGLHDGVAIASELGDASQSWDDPLVGDTVGLSLLRGERA